MVKELKTQASTHKFSCLDAVMAELKWWMMWLITDEDNELQLSDLSPSMVGGDTSKESCKRKREVSRKPVPEVEVAVSPPRQIECLLRPISSNVEGESSGPTVRTLSQGAQHLIQSLERNRSTQGNPSLAKVMGASICFQEYRNRLAEESINDILTQTMSLGLEAIANQHDASAAQAQLSSANDYIARLEDRIKRCEEKIVEVEQELEVTRAGRSVDLARFAEELHVKEEELRAKEEELQAKEEESTTKEAGAYVNAHNDLLAELRKRYLEEDLS
ncbi:uncharacterized protein LOC131177924 [Hevea brasiliensis]|uniref:uncharacterized protein LOC131177924 n=1 Tax=Hevea brasiliensis TaxID=3981 RepID=UPI0025F664A2|nr:uncharacterized protein LOC131177924 [Hevea brasiliensis]